MSASLCDVFVSWQKLQSFASQDVDFVCTKGNVQTVAEHDLYVAIYREDT